MFNIDHIPEFDQTVEVRMPRDDGVETQTFKARFRVIPDEEEETGRLNWVAQAKARLRARIVSFDDIVDGKGKAIPFDDALLDRMLAREDVRIALFEAYANGLTEARTGN